MEHDLNLSGDVAPYRFPEVTGGVRREDSLGLVREYLEHAPSSPLATWARTLVS